MVYTNRCLGALLFILIILGMASPASLAEDSHSSVSLLSDQDCVVLLDGKLFGRLKHGNRGELLVGSGPHKLSAVNDEGELWEQTFEAGSGLSFEISFAKIHADRLALQAKVTALKAQVEEQREQLDRIRQQNLQMAQDADLIQHERKLIVKAINYYADHYAKQLGLHNSLEAEGMGLVSAASQPATGPAGDSNTAAVAKLIEEIFGFIWLWRAHRHEVTAHWVQERIGELEADLKDPLKRPRVPGRTDYLILVHSVLNKKISGQVLTAPGWVEYKDPQADMKLTCNESPRAKGGRKVEIRYVESSDRGHTPTRHKGGRRTKGKFHKKTLHLTTNSKKEGKLLITDVFVACSNE